ncbi:TetR/AcrR family transcriptional regulator [Nitratireductor sp. ZSWI3]|uniref:TetR/AcrR family transcriptional regulator n=1 Tax=Nitratireductor sp. ZSWI3 TaxID=2966359 RepID=UPI00214F986A|nr:TetR/AcrR family transcriptional regulator [Nitratireductor sp. ZSWI3]MCR4268003.1 TetR/AcrR family transcriptional regulator [Nitratireductor sp. ZSWI3]
MSQRTNDPEGTRRQVVNAAFELFTRKGYEGTPMHAVRDLAGVSSGALAHHFPTKRDLGLAVIRGPVAEAIAGTWIEPVARASSASAGVRSVFEATIADIVRTGTVAGCPLGNLAAELSTRNDALRFELNAIFDRWREAIAAKLQAQQPPDAAGNKDAGALANLIVACFSGAILMAKASQSAVPLQACWTHLQNILEARTQKGDG